MKTMLSRVANTVPGTTIRIVVSGDIASISVETAPREDVPESPPMHDREKQRNRVLELRQKGWKVKQIMEETSVHRSTVYRWLAKARKE